MQFTLLAAFLLTLFLDITTAAPSRIQKRSFKVVRARNENFKGYNGPKELLRAYRKYSMPLPPGLLESLRGQGSGLVGGDTVGVESTQAKASGVGLGQAGQSGCCACPSNVTGAGTEKASAGAGVVTATPENGDIAYLAPVTIGGQTLNLDFDTGSSDLWVFNTQLAKNAVRGHKVYDPTQSNTFQAMRGATFTIRYGDESGASGNVGTDVVDIGGVTVPNQAVELATAVSQSFIDDMPNNGLLGLAFSSINTVKPQPQKTFFDNVMPTLAEPVFTADLRPNAVGAYEFGRIDSTKFTGQMAWVPVNSSDGFWQFPTSGFAVGNTANPVRTATSQAIADTGTTLMLVSQDVADGYYSQVPGAKNDATAGGITVPCDATLPDLFVDVGGVYTARIKGSDINFAPVSGNTCFGGIQPTTAPLQIWGDIFFKSQFVAFNGGNSSLGMAQHI
ncbi:penicillopepsin [Echria macrotheca]|uniref:Penicillopepsin n=1 Tax=Echria macrotheca TaxID=438768 RepID=A0AAJ0BIY4_9PEZI|nr:penicillopepsin [Echria macrotheca]